MPITPGSYVNWTFDDQQPQAWSNDPSKWGLTNTYHSPIVVNYDRGRLYRMYYAETDTDLLSNPVTHISVFGITTYNVSTKAPTAYLDLEAYFAGDSDTRYDDLFAFWLLPKSYEGTGADLALVGHRIGGEPAGIASDIRLTLVNLDLGTVLDSVSVPTFAAVGGSGVLTSPSIQHGQLCNIGNTPNNWYLIARNNGAGANGGADYFTVNEIESNGATGSITERHAFGSIGSGVGATMNSLNTWRSDTDGISYWTSHDLITTPKLDYIKWPWPWASPTSSLNVYSYSSGPWMGNQLFHTVGGINYLVATRYDLSVSPDRSYVETLTFVTPTGTYTKIYDATIHSDDASITAHFIAENALFGAFNNTFLLQNSTRKGTSSTFIQTATGVETLWVLCIPEGTLTVASDLFDDTFASILDDMSGTYYLADPGGADSFDSDEIKSRIVSFVDLCLSEQLVGRISGLTFSEEWDTNYTDWTIFKEAL